MSDEEQTLEQILQEKDDDEFLQLLEESKGDERSPFAKKVCKM